MGKGRLLAAPAHHEVAEPGVVGQRLAREPFARLQQGEARAGGEMLQFREEQVAHGVLLGEFRTRPARAGLREQRVVHGHEAAVYIHGRLREPGHAHLGGLRALDAHGGAIRQDGGAIPKVEDENAASAQGPAGGMEVAAQRVVGGLVVSDVEKRDCRVEPLVRLETADVALDQPKMLPLTRGEPRAFLNGPGDHPLAQIHAQHAVAAGDHFPCVPGGAAAQLDQRARLGGVLLQQAAHELRLARVVFVAVEEVVVGRVVFVERTHHFRFR